VDSPVAAAVDLPVGGFFVALFLVAAGRLRGVGLIWVPPTRASWRHSGNGGVCRTFEVDGGELGPGDEQCAGLLSARVIEIAQRKRFRCPDL
jgi:hypothetical protein